MCRCSPPPHEPLPAVAVEFGYPYPWHERGPLENLVPCGCKYSYFYNILMMLAIKMLSTGLEIMEKVDFLQYWTIINISDTYNKHHLHLNIASKLIYFSGLN